MGDSRTAKMTTRMKAIDRVITRVMQADFAVEVRTARLVRLSERSTRLANRLTAKLQLALASRNFILAHRLLQQVSHWRTATERFQVAARCLAYPRGAP